MVKKILFVALFVVGGFSSARMYAACTEDTSGTLECQKTYDANGNFLSENCGNPLTTVIVKKCVSKPEEPEF